MRCARTFIAALRALSIAGYSSAQTVRCTTWNLEWFPNGSAKEASPAQQEQRIKEAADVIRPIDLLIIKSGLRCWFAHFKLCAHFLQPRSKRVNLPLLGIYLTTCFQELVQQHRVHRVVADCVWLSVFIANDQIGIHFFDLLGHQTK